MEEISQLGSTPVPTHRPLSLKVPIKKTSTVDRWCPKQLELCKSEFKSCLDVKQEFIDGKLKFDCEYI